MTKVEDMLMFMCGFGAADAETIGYECSRRISDWSANHPGDPVPEEIVSQSLLTALDEHVATLPADEQNRLEDAVKALHETFAEPDGLIVAV